MPSLMGGIALNDEVISILEDLKNKEINYSLG